MKARPISPGEVTAAKKSALPGAVLEGFNAEIARRWDGGQAVVKQSDVIVAILRIDSTLTRDQLFDCGWLDVEPIYRAAGWSVRYDKPAYNETYPATFTFRKKGRRL